MKTVLRVSFSFVLLLLLSSPAFSQTYSGLRAVIKDGVSYSIHRFSKPRFQFENALGPVMTFYSGTTAANYKVHIGKDNLTFTSANYKLYVQDGILSESLKINNPQTWSDFVFDEDYTLNSLESVDAFIRKQGHLPGVPSEAQLKATGYYDQHEINKVLLQKIEELTLYVIAQNKEIELLKALNKQP